MSIETLPAGLTPPPARGRSHLLIGELIVELGFASREAVHDAVGTARASGRPTGQVLVDDGTITPDQLAQALARRIGLYHVDLARFPVDMGAANLLEPSVARRHGAVPIGFLDEARTTLLVAMADPANVLAVDDIALLTGCEVQPAIAAAGDVLELTAKLDRFGEAAEQAVADSGAHDEADVEDLGEVVEEAPVVKFVHSIIAQAVERGASDVHVAPHGGELRGQYRIDGVLSDAFSIPARMAPHVISRIKIMADLDISERRLPQDGRLPFTFGSRRVDVRVVTLPLVDGESVVMRILDRGGGAVSLDDLGMLGSERARFEAAIARPYGAVLVTGPTGSGKTTSLYAALQTLNTGERSILTLEDPVEYRVAGVKQMQVNVKAGVTFATGLRSMVRADPDVMLVGEIRDRETAQIAIESALTGHLVLSTLHTNDAPTAITRLIEMGIEPFLVASAIDCVVAQRLARRLCERCRRPVSLSAEVLRANGFHATGDVHAFDPVGCGTCNGSGYRGRIGIFETMPVSDAIRDHVLARDPATTIAATAVAEGMRRLRDDALEKIRAGLTSAAEAARVTVAS
ncbi:MAG: Flp pilus assembly complex ATPase component TadA [Actinobacteria bacterium]|nr:Flp pilus assembly complex ATPase component TadA [Actinomycetota bacterium]